MRFVHGCRMGPWGQVTIHSFPEPKTWIPYQDSSLYTYLSLSLSVECCHNPVGQF